LKRLAAFGAAALLALAGCGRSGGPIDQRALTLAIAADPAQGGSNHFTMLAPSPESLSSGGGNEFYEVAATAATLGGAISSMEDATSRDVYLGQLRLVLLNLALAPGQRDALLAEEARFGETDHTEWLAFAEGKAAPLLQPPSEEERLPAYFYDIQFNCRNCQSADRGMPVWQADAELAGPGATTVAPVISLRQGQVEVDRVAAWRRGRPPLVFTPQESLAVMALRGRMGKGTLTFPTVLGEASVRSMRAQVSRRAEVGPHGLLHLTARVDLTGEVMRSPKRVLRLTPAATAAVESGCATAMAQLLTTVVAKAQAAGSDPFYFARALYLRDPEAYRAAGPWQDAFRRAQVRLDVHVRVPEKGIIV